MALTSFSSIFVDSKVNKFYQMNGAVTVNTTIEMEENAYTKSEVVKRDIKRKLIEVIQVKKKAYNKKQTMQKNKRKLIEVIRHVRTTLGTGTSTSLVRSTRSLESRTSTSAASPSTTIVGSSASVLTTLEASPVNACLGEDFEFIFRLGGFTCLPPNSFLVTEIDRLDILCSLEGIVNPVLMSSARLEVII